MEYLGALARFTAHLVRFPLSAYFSGLRQSTMKGRSDEQEYLVRSFSNSPRSSDIFTSNELMDNRYCCEFLLADIRYCGPCYGSQNPRIKKDRL